MGFDPDSFRIICEKNLEKRRIFVSFTSANICSPTMNIYSPVVIIYSPWANICSAWAIICSPTANKEKETVSDSFSGCVSKFFFQVFKNISQQGIHFLCRYICRQRETDTGRSFRNGWRTYRKAIKAMPAQLFSR